MVSQITDSRRHGSRSFQKVVDMFLSGKGFPSAQVLIAKRIERVYAKHGAILDTNGVHATTVISWSFLSQVPRDGQKISCQATAARVMDLAFGPYKGKETGESVLLRLMMVPLLADDIAVLDRYYCSFKMIALLLAEGTHTCARKHHLRQSDCNRGRRLGRHDHLIIWTRP